MLLSGTKILSQFVKLKAHVVRIQSWKHALIPIAFL